MPMVLCLRNRVTEQVNVTWVLAAPDGSGKWELGNGGYVPGRSLELDPMGDEVPIDNPYYSGGGDDLGHYPLYGDAGNFGSGCTVDGSPINCEVIGKVISRNQFEFLYNTINKRIGGRSPSQRVSGRNSGGSTAANVYGSQDTRTGTWYAGMDVIAEPDYLDATTVGYSMIWLNLRPLIHSITIRPLNTGVAVPIGGAEKLKTLVNKTLAFGDCEKALDAFLAKIGQDTGVAPSHASFQALISAISSQTGGGGLYADVPAQSMDNYIPAAARLNSPQPAGGGGLAWYFYVGGQRQRISLVFLMSAYTNSPRLSFERVPFVYAARAIHELVHNAPNDLSPAESVGLLIR
jgi:hypothetical protein